MIITVNINGKNVTEDIEADLKEASVIYKRWGGFRSNRVFLTGANPFVLSFEKLMDISRLIHKQVFPYSNP